MTSRGRLPEPPSGKGDALRPWWRLRKGPTFIRLNDGWNAEPNAPEPEVVAGSSTIELRFVLNWQIYDVAVDELGTLRFNRCSRWRLGPTNDEGWYRGQCRYSRLAPAWGEFYEIVGPDPLAVAINDWRMTGAVADGQRHFLFYLRDSTFECFADDWTFTRSASISEFKS